MWDSLKEHIALIGSMVVGLIVIVGTLLKFSLDKGILGPIKDLGERMRAAEAGMKKLENNYVAEFRSVRKEISDAGERTIREQGESERRIVAAVDQLKDHIANNYVRRDEHLQHINKGDVSHG
jgi:hypothetical protein